jgi:hypothetical protein
MWSSRSSFGMSVVVCACLTSVGCSTSRREIVRRDCEIWQDDQPFALEPFCNSVQFLMMSIRSETAGELDPDRMVGRVVTWTRRGRSYGRWQKLPDWFVSPDGGPVTY